MNEPCAQNLNLLNNKNKSLDNDRKRKIEGDINNMNDNSQSKHLKSNYYSLLDNEFECDEESLSQYKKHLEVHNKQQKTSVQPSTSASCLTDQLRSTAAKTSNNNTKSNERIRNPNKEDNNQNNREKIPPINIYNVESNEAIKFIKNGLKINDFKIKELNKKIILYLTNMSNFARVKTYLEKTKTHFYTYTPKNNKNKTYLLKGLNANNTTDEILQELRIHENENLKFVKVNQFITTKSKREGYILPIFLVQISPESDTKQLKNIRGILYRCVKWEPLKKPEIQQCRNCQGFFHSAVNCFLQHRCVKCNETHEIGKCNVPNETENERDKLFCVLCNKYGHPASYKGCEKYKELQNKIKARRQLLKQNSKINPNFVNPNISYANTLRRELPTDDLTNTNMNMQNPFFVELKNTLTSLTNQMINLQKQLQIQSTRIDTLFSFIDV